MRVNQDAYQQCDLTWKRVKASSIHLTRDDLFKANILDCRESEKYSTIPSYLQCSKGLVKPKIDLHKTQQ